MEAIFLGVDIAGASNTWVCGLCPVQDHLEILLPPSKQSLAKIIQYCENNNVVSVAIDAQLTGSVSDENGFRSSDMQLRELLPPEFRVWVASQNSMMAVPVRGRQLAEALSPIVGTIIETHPRSCLYFNDPQKTDAVRYYKSVNGNLYLRSLWNRWTERFSIHGNIQKVTDGAVDSLVCATIAYLFHREPEKLLKLHHDSPYKTGRGPFCILR